MDKRQVLFRSSSVYQNALTVSLYFIIMDEQWFTSEMLDRRLSESGPT